MGEQAGTRPTETQEDNMAATFKHEGKVYELHEYVDAYAGMKGTDKAKDTCGSCGGDGVYHAPSGYVIANPYVKGTTFKGCFRCMGRGYRMVNVSTLRRYARQDAFAAEYADMLAAQRAEAIAVREAAELAANFARDWDAAHAEQARRASLVQGFVGEVGEKLTGLHGVVQVAKYIEGSWNRSSSMFVVVKLDSGQLVKTFSSSASVFGLERGDVVTIAKATVKGQEAYNGQEQTVLSHVKVEAEEKEA
jgi:hypothetical protein